MVSVGTVYRCGDVRVELGATNLVTISDISDDEIALYKRDLASLYEILCQLAKDGVMEGVSVQC